MDRAFSVCPKSRNIFSFLFSTFILCCNVYTYIEKILEQLDGRIILNARIDAIQRTASKVIEAHEFPGGYGHTFEMRKKDNRYRFNAQLHYVWNCGEGETVNLFLKKLGLERKVTFERSPYVANGLLHIEKRLEIFKGDPVSAVHPAAGL